MQPYQKETLIKKIVAGFVAAIIASGLIIAIIFYELNKNVTTTTPTTTQTASQNTAATPTTASAYKDGTYSASSNYYVPNSSESITVTVTLANDVVTSSSLRNSQGDPESAQYQRAFTAAYKSKVVGKTIKSIHLSRVAGASDTTGGFNQALDSIMQQARA